MSEFPEAESSVLGSLMISPEIAGDVFRRLRPEDFQDATLRNLFAAARDVFLSRRPLDPVVLLDAAGDSYRGTIAQIMRDTPTAANYAVYCNIVADGAQLRRLQAAAMSVMDCRNADDARQAMAAAQGLLAQRTRKRRWNWEEMSDSFLERLGGEPEAFLDWGIPGLNEHLKIRPHNFVLLAAESSVGKTALALQIAFGMAAAGTRVGFYSLETLQPDAADRLYAQLAGAPLPGIKNHTLGESLIKACYDTAYATQHAKFDLIEAAGFTVDELRADAIANGYEVVFVDYVQLLEAEGRTPLEQVRSISMGLHRMALELGVTVIGLSQVTPPQKNLKGERPELSKENLRESHQLIHDAEAILILDLADLNDYRGNRILKVDKNKDGPRCRLLLAFDGPRLRFTPLDPMRDTDAAKSAARNAKMDANRAARQEKAARAKGVSGQSSFEDLPDNDGELPF